MKTIKLKLPLKIFAVVLFTLAIASCSNRSPKETFALEDVAISETYDAVAANNKVFDTKEVQADTIQSLKIIKSANVRFKVKSVKTATKEIETIVRKSGGYVSDQRLQNSNYKVENRFTIKIPQKNFNTLLDSLVQVAEFVEYQNITSDDVSEEYVDLQSRLQTKLEVKKHYEVILRKRANKVEDILAAEEMIGGIQEEIEATQGRLKYLTNKVSFSTVQVDLYETVHYKEEPTEYKRTFFSKTKEGLSFGWKLIEHVFLGIIHIWPLFVLGGIVLVILRKRIKK